ncbi:MAG: acyl-CoA/acyl-ACP dehydrogenase [Acidimicrobiia bacterium]|nr:acyl-CoA/acyl-ACP dehydrogenase [Acidimicrobiia bacterium]
MIDTVDFSLDEHSEEVAALASRILGDKVTEERLRHLTATGDLYDEAAWSALCDAGLVSMCLPAADGGGDMTLLEAALVAEEVGRRVAPVPYVPTVVCAMGIAHFGSDAQRTRWLAPLGDGQAIAGAALAEHHDRLARERPQTTATRTDGGWRLSGDKPMVTWAPHADLLLVSAATDDGVAVFIVEPTDGGVTLVAEQTTSGLPEASLHLDDVLLDDDRRLPVEGAVSWLADALAVGLCAVQSGVSAEALRLTAAYTSERHQFSSPIATFQAVAQRAADAFIDARGVRFTMLQAAWRLSEGLEGTDEVDIAAVWAADGGQRVAHAAQHLHGGIGVDTDYPLHRTFLWAKHLELALGGATVRLVSMGRRMAEQAATGSGAGSASDAAHGGD